MELANQVYTLLFRDRPSDRRSKSKEAVGGPAVTEEVFPIMNTFNHLCNSVFFCLKQHRR